MNILCFAPRSGDVAVADPVALLCAMRLVEQAGHKVEVVQSVRGGNHMDRLRLAANRADIFAVSVITSRCLHEALAATKLVKLYNPNCVVVWGGWHCSIMPDKVLEQVPDVSIVVAGQGERIMANVIWAIQSCGRPMRQVMRAEFEDVNKFPPIPYHLINMRQNLRVSKYGKRTLRYVSSQGCPHRCGFCVEPTVFGHKWSGLKASRVVQELMALRDAYSIDSVVFTDSNFFTDKQRALDIAEGMLSQGLELTWGDVNGRTHQLLQYKEREWALLARSGLRTVLVGAESGLDCGMEVIKKDCTVEETKQLVEVANRHGVSVVMSMMIGLPCFDPEKEFKAALDLARACESKRSDTRNAYLIFTYTPYPGTALYPLALSCGAKEPQSIEGWADYELGKSPVPWVPARLARQAAMVTEYIGPWTSGHFLSLLRGKATRQAGKWISKLCQWRWNRGWFGLPLDYWLFKLILQLWRR